MRNTAEVSQGLALVALEWFTLCMTGLFLIWKSLMLEADSANFDE